jgi:isopenicillin N synthase-like dioxygenase
MVHRRTAAALRRTMMQQQQQQQRRSMSLTPCGHPLIDIAALKAKCEITTSNLRTALLHHGYFYATNVSQLPISYITSLYDYSTKCHALPLSIKYKYRQRDGGTGAYSGPDIGLPELQYEGTGKMARVHGWDYSRAQFSLAAAALYSGNDDSACGSSHEERYPNMDEIVPSYVTVLDECYSRQNELAHVILTGFERALYLPHKTLLSMFNAEGGDFGTIRLLYYPGDDDDGSSSSNEDGISNDDTATNDTTTGIGAHTDFECFTLMHQTAPGLQILPRSVNGHTHKWMDMPVRQSEFVVIIGDMLERLTNGTLLATPHRVLPTKHARQSIIRFNAFAPNMLIAPLQQFVSDERPVAYSPVRMSTHMEVTMKNLEAGMGSWDTTNQRSTSANYDYGGEWHVLEVDGNK